MIFILLVWVASNHATAQNTGEIIITEDLRNRTLQDFFNILEEKYGVRVFYKEEWIKQHKINRNFENTPLIQALNNLFIENELTFRFFQDNDVVVFPESHAGGNRMHESTQVLIIGNPLNLGRYKTARLTGKIIDGQTGEPLVGAVVYQAQQQKGSSTDADGIFEMELPTGDHQLRFSFIGFEEATWNIRLIEDGYEEFELFEESHAIGEVMVVGKENNLPRSQMSMVEMSSVEIKKLPALMGEVDVLKGITMMPGVQSVGELSSGFNVRGGNTDQNMIFIEGSPVFNASHLFGFLSLINPDVVQDVRLFKGGLPARLGERVASVMEVGFKDGNDEQIRFYGGIGLINSRLTLEGPLTENKKLTFVAGGRSSYANWILKEVPELTFSRSVTHFYDVSGKMTYRFDSHSRLSLMAYRSHDEFSTSAQSVNRYGNFLANMKMNFRLSEKLYNDLELAHSEYAYRLTDYGNMNDLQSYHLDNNLMYSSAGYNVRWHPQSNHKAVAGIKAIHYSVNPGEISPVEERTRIESRALNHENAIEWSVFAEDEIEILPQFSLSAGLRYSSFMNRGPDTVYIYNPEKPKLPENVSDSLHFEQGEVSKSYGGLEPRLSARYDLNANTSLKISFQRVRQYMFQLSNNAVISPAETWKPADYHIKPLINDQVVAGLENNSWIKTVEFAAEVYYKRLQNLIEYKSGARLIMNEHVETALIPADGYSYGIELSANKSSGRLTGQASYVLSRTMRKTSSMFNEETFWMGDYYPSVYDKPHDVSATLNYDISRRWRFSANVIYISGRPVTLPEIKYQFAGETLIWYSDRNKYRMPPYHRVDVSLTFDENLRRKRMWKGSWTLSVYNLYGRENPYSVYYRKSASGTENNFRRYSLYKLSVIGIPVPSLTYNFKF
ncbi:MAG: TonB-dependent receptor [Mariniphaga sp.]